MCACACVCARVCACARASVRVRVCGREHVPLPLPVPVPVAVAVACACACACTRACVRVRVCSRVCGRELGPVPAFHGLLAPCVVVTARLCCRLGPLVLGTLQTATRMYDSAAYICDEESFMKACAEHHSRIGDHDTAMLLYSRMDKKGLCNGQKARLVYADEAKLCGNKEVATAQYLKVQYCTFSLRLPHCQSVCLTLLFFLLSLHGFDASCGACASWSVLWGSCDVVCPICSCYCASTTA